jgi:hypothetical protein
MTPMLVVVAAVTIVGGIVATSGRDARLVVLGLLIVLLATPLLVNPWPSPVALLARVAAALLAARLLAIAVRGVRETSASPLGWPAQTLAVVAGVVAGVASHGLGAPGLGAAAGQAAGFALIAVAAAPLAASRDPLRLGAAAILLVEAGVLVRLALAGPPSDGEQLALALLTIGLGSAVAVVVTGERLSSAARTTEPSTADSPRPGPIRSGRSRFRTAGR